MRKRFKSKKRSCGLCKPHKKGMAVRWKDKDLCLPEVFEKEMGIAMARGGMRVLFKKQDRLAFGNLAGGYKESLFTGWTPRMPRVLGETVYRHCFSGSTGGRFYRPGFCRRPHLGIHIQKS